LTAIDPPGDPRREVFSKASPDQVDPHLPTEPAASGELSAVFKWEDEAEDGEDIGPLIVSDPNEGVIWETADWIRVSEARALADAKGWRFAIDG
jgi:hypothetical protein